MNTIGQYSKMQCVPISGGNWNNTSNAGVGTLNLNNNRTNSNNNVGLRDCVSEPETAMADTGNIGVYCPAISEINGEGGLLSNSVENQSRATKKRGNLYEAAFSIENLYEAFIDARKGKRKKRATLAADENITLDAAADKILSLRDAQSAYTAGCLARKWQKLAALKAEVGL